MTVIVLSHDALLFSFLGNTFKREMIIFVGLTKEKNDNICFHFRVVTRMTVFYHCTLLA